MTEQDKPRDEGRRKDEPEGPETTAEDAATESGWAAGAETAANEAAERDPYEEIAELNERLLRLAAEIENTRRRAEREKADTARYAIANFARDLLSVADTFQRALQSAPKPDATVSQEGYSAFLSGIEMTDKELLAALERHGVRRITPKGERFDPNLHQAVAQAPGDIPAGHVLDVAQPGFIIGDRILRAAMVVVSTGPSTDENPGSDEPGERLDARA